MKLLFEFILYILYFIFYVVLKKYFLQLIMVAVDVVEF
jgi:hypothetical protein